MHETFIISTNPSCKLGPTGATWPVSWPDDVIGPKTLTQLRQFLRILPEWLFVFVIVMILVSCAIYGSR